MKIAVIGAGRIGAMHAKTLCELPAVEEVLVVDADSARAEAVAEELECTYTREVDDIWGLSIDGVVVASATRSHPGLVNAALNHGVSVLCEKPLTIDHQESRRLSERARDSGVYVTVGFQRRFDPAFRALRQEVAEGKYGSAYVLQMTHADMCSPPLGYLSTFPGTMFVDMCVHDYDAMRLVAGSEIESVVAEAATITDVPEYRKYGDVDTIVTTMRFTNGSIGVLQASRHSPDGYQASVRVQSSVAQGGTPADWRSTSWMERFSEAFREEARQFVSVLVGAGERGATAGDATSALEIAVAAEISWREGRRVELEEVERQSRAPSDVA